MTDDQLGRMRPAREVLAPALHTASTKRGRPRSERSKVLATLRLDPAVPEAYRATGPVWQVRMGEVPATGLGGHGEATSGRRDWQTRFAPDPDAEPASVAAVS